MSAVDLASLSIKQLEDLLEQKKEFSKKNLDPNFVKHSATLRLMRYPLFLPVSSI